MFILVSSVLFMFHIMFMIFSIKCSPFIMEMELFSLFSFPFSLILMFDWVSFSFSSFVLLISSFILLYSDFYMKGELFMNRFIIILTLFVISMVLLIFGGNLFFIMVGWDGLGLVSFCLVIYYSDKEAMVSGILTILMNRLGDGLILISMFFMNLMNSFYIDLMLISKMGCLLLLISFLTKSAQFPFSSWLPAAMSAPTPISSLVHSSTLVTAGIYLSIRFNFLFNDMLNSYMLMVLSLVTMLIGGGMALSEMDFKKIVAMSTLSQLGLLFFLISIGSYKLSFFHMISHAFFKSLLFMSTGSIILSGSQDSRGKGGFTIYSPIIMSGLVVSLFCLMAVPFTVGFLSKDLALDFLFSSNKNLIFYLMFMIGSLMTVMYSIRMMKSLLKFFQWESVKTNSKSVFMMISMIMSITSTLLWGVYLYQFILMEDFILVSFPMKMMGLSLIILSILVKFDLGFYLYSMFMWTKYTIKPLFSFDFLFKFDQLWIEKQIMLLTNIPTNFSMKFIDINMKTTWTSFFSLWFILFIYMSS